MFLFLFHVSTSRVFFSVRCYTWKSFCRHMWSSSFVRHCLINRALSLCDSFLNLSGSFRMLHFDLYFYVIQTQQSVLVKELRIVYFFPILSKVFTDSGSQNCLVFLVLSKRLLNVFHVQECSSFPLRSLVRCGCSRSNLVPLQILLCWNCFSCPCIDK